MIDQDIFIDTNILLYTKIEDNQFFEVSCNKLQNLHKNNNLFISTQVLREYWAALSKLPNVSNPIHVSIIFDDIEYYMQNFIVLEDYNTTSEKLFHLAKEYKVIGKQIHDANIVATMLTNGIKSILTHNVADFNRYNKLINIIPLIN
ncbi:MAG: PIN domain-containing protein [Candidatus Kapabacteria bacterium]|jgi:predicted nucleic acid-binding protein|nr:PIN domain-containing protein [Candidatus Kapabacteria bacterium]